VLVTDMIAAWQGARHWISANPPRNETSVEESTNRSRGLARALGKSFLELADSKHALKGTIITRTFSPIPSVDRRPCARWWENIYELSCGFGFLAYDTVETPMESPRVMGAAAPALRDSMPDFFSLAVTSLRCRHGFIPNFKVFTDRNIDFAGVFKREGQTTRFGHGR